MKITEAESKERRERIIHTAFDLFCERGIEQVTMSDIAKASRVGDSTIYRYFGTKPLLVYSALSILWHRINLKLEQYMEQAGPLDGMTGLRQTEVRLHVFSYLYTKHANYVLFSYEAKLYLQRNGIQLTKDELDEMMYDLKEPCMASLKKGMEDGSIRVQIDPEDLFYAIWGCVRGYIVKIVIYSGLCVDHGPWESRYHLVIDGILHALQTPEPDTETFPNK